MDANWRPTQGSDPAAIAAGVDPNAAAPAGGEWRAQFQPEARSRIVNKIMDTLKKHLPVSVPEGLDELQKIAVQFEEKIYTAATNQSDYLRKISLKILYMETKTREAPGNAQVNPNQNNSGPAPGLPPQGSNQAQSSAIPLMSEQQARQPNTSASIQASSLTNIGQNLPGVSQTSRLQNVSVMPQNMMNNGLARGTSQDIYAAHRQMPQIAGRQPQQQQSQSQIIYQQQQMLMKQKLQQNSLMQPHIQQQQSLLQSTQMQSSQQPMMQISSGHHPGQSTIPQTQPMAMQSATQGGIHQNPLNSVQQSVQSLVQQPEQSGVRQQQQPQPSMHQQPSLQQAQPSQQPNTALQQQQQQFMGQQPNLQQSQLIGQQYGAVEMQQQERLPFQSNNLLNMQQTQQMLNQQSMPLHQPQQLGSQANMSSLQQQQQLLGTVPNVSNMQRMHMLQTKAQQPQQQQHSQQPSMGLMQAQSQHNQLQQSQQHLVSQFQSQPNQLQQQLGMQQQSSMQQRHQTKAGMLLQQNNIDQQKQFIQQVSSSTSVDSTAQTGHAGAGDSQEEIYQMIKSLKDQYFAELSDLYNKISVKLQHVDSMIPPQRPSEQYERMKSFKIMLERILQILQCNKSNIQPALRDKIPQYEKQIISILNSQRRPPLQQTQGQQQFQPPAGQAPSSNISQQQQPSQSLQQHDSHTNPQANLSSCGDAGTTFSGCSGSKRRRVPPVICLSPEREERATIQRNSTMQVSRACAEAAPKEPIFTCPVCLNKLEQPSTTTCGHIFCEKCIKASIKAQKKCPTCRKSLGMRSYHRVYLPETADQGC